MEEYEWDDHLPVTEGAKNLADCVDPDTLQQVAKQLHHLWHARKCRQRILRTKGDTWRCTQPLCKHYVKILNHFSYCGEPGCTPEIRSLVDHWVRCEPKSCTFCRPPRIVRPGFEAKSWHQTLSQEEREYLMELLNLATHEEMLDPRISYAGYLEKNIYWSAGSRKEYLHRMAETMTFVEMAHEEAISYVLA